jgi:hypothetical protein
VLGELLHPFEGVLAIGWIQKIPSVEMPIKVKAADNAGFPIVHVLSSTPWHYKGTTWVEIELPERLNQAQGR